MRQPETTREMSTPLRDDVLALVDAVAVTDGQRPLSDQHWLELTQGGQERFAAVTCRRDGELIGYAQLAAGNDSWSVELLIHPEHRDDRRRLGAVLLAAALDEVRARAADHAGRASAPTRLFWWVFGPDADDVALADSVGLRAGRELLQMRRPLPTDVRAEVTTRSFRPGEDETAWLAVNNRAFAAHPEQGGWTLETLRQRQAESWFDPDGFRLHERDGRLAAFCWTKLHVDQQPVLGEIYVIAVDPDFQALGLGRQLTLAGLDSIAGRRVDVGMLYVDAGNTGAVTMYERLGFTTHRTDVAFVADV